MNDNKIKSMILERDLLQNGFNPKVYEDLGVIKSHPVGGRVLNANTVSTDLQRTAVMTQMVRAFAKKLLPITVFSTTFNGVPLQGTDEVVVSYYALDASASTDFVAANGYDTFGGTATSSKKVTVNKRKYQGITFDSSTAARQPAFVASNVLTLKAQKLATDVWTDVLSVVTAANFSTAAFTGAASGFDSDDVADLRGVANAAQWPDRPRALVVHTDYDTALMKDGSIKSSNEFGGSEAIRQGQVPIILGFDYHQSGNIPDNSENLVGFITAPSAVLTAFSPIRPAEDIIEKVRYEVITDIETGITLEFRAWGDPDMDASRQTIECNYGFVTGEAAALKRLVSA
jgi:hypothetical protein